MYSLAERGEINLDEAPQRNANMAVERARAATPEERSAVRQLPKGMRILRKALPRMLEHDREHLTELSRRAGYPGP